VLHVWRVQVAASSEFQLRLRSYRNDDGRAGDGYCCTGAPRGAAADGRCTGTCRTFFRICLSHYTADIRPAQPCTFGLLVTDVLGNDSIDFRQLTAVAAVDDAAAVVADDGNFTTSSPVAGDVDNASSTTIPATNPVRMPISVTWPVRLFRIGGFTTMRYINPRSTYVLTYFRRTTSSTAGVC